jgi:adenine deaminase
MGMPNTSEPVAMPEEASLRVSAQSGRDIRVITAIPKSVLTKELRTAPTIRDGLVVSDVARDIIKLVVLEKNKGTGRVAVGFVNGFGLARGAIGSSVAHDAHNYLVMGVDDTSIMTAMKYLIDNRGGLVTADGNAVVSSLPLPIGGLMSDMDPRSLAAAQGKICASAADLGVTMPLPFMTMSFLSLSVIPALKLTDRGYVNILEGGIRGLFV